MVADDKEMIQLLKEAYEDLELFGLDACECDPSVGVECFPCRLRKALHRYDPSWICAIDAERGMSEIFHEFKGDHILMLAVGVAEGRVK